MDAVLPREQIRMFFIKSEMLPQYLRPYPYSTVTTKISKYFSLAWIHISRAVCSVDSYTNVLVQEKSLIIMLDEFFNVVGHRKL